VTRSSWRSSARRQIRAALDDEGVFGRPFSRAKYADDRLMISGLTRSTIHGYAVMYERATG
jgi:hypothetical protein